MERDDTGVDVQGSSPGRSITVHYGAQNDSETQPEFQNLHGIGSTHQGPPTSLYLCMEPQGAILHDDKNYNTFSNASPQVRIKGPGQPGSCPGRQPIRGTDSHWNNGNMILVNSGYHTRNNFSGNNPRFE